MKNKSLKSNVLLNLIKTIMSLIFPLITFPYASRVLTPVGIGKVNFATSVICCFAVVASLGISGYGIREAAKLREDKEKLSKFAKDVFSINLASTAVAYSLLLAAVIFIPKLSMYRSLICVCSSTILFTTLGMDWLYTALEDFKYITIRSIIFQGIGLILLFAFVKNSDDYLKYAAVSVFANVGSNICNFIHSRKYVAFRIGGKIEWRTHFTPIFTLFALAITSSIYTMLDTTMLGFITDDWNVGIYTASTKVNRLVVSLVTSVGTVVLPRLSYYFGTKKEDEFKRLSLQSVDLILMLALPSIIGLSILSETVIVILSGESYISAVPVMRVMNPIILIVGLSNFVGVQIFLPLGKEKWTLYSNICGAAVNFALNLLLIPKCGALGAAIASVLAEGTVTLVQLILARNYIDIKHIINRVIYYFVLAAIMGAVVFIVAKMVKNVVWQLMLATFAGVMVYGILLTVTGNPITTSIIRSLHKRNTCK